MCLFIVIITINSGLMYQVVNPTFMHLEGLASWYWVVPYIVALFVMRNLPRRINHAYILYVATALLLFTWLFIITVYRGKYAAEFVLDGKGVVCRTQAKQAKKNKVINALTVVLGGLSGNQAAAGAGMLAQSRQEVTLRWNRVERVKYRPKSRTILLRGGWTEQIALFCTENDYKQVEAFVGRNIPFPENGRDR
jgi:hypothetical protein